MTETDLIETDMTEMTKTDVTESYVTETHDRDRCETYVTDVPDVTETVVDAIFRLIDAILHSFLSVETS